MCKYLSFVEVVDDLTTETLFAMPFALRRIVQELSEGSFLPVEQLPVQQECERRLCETQQLIKLRNVHKVMYELAMKRCGHSYFCT